MKDTILNTFCSTKSTNLINNEKQNVLDESNNYDTKFHRVSVRMRLYKYSVFVFKNELIY